jgi:NADPH:quinone reductase-like Zn-dependent oxidoreductase
MRYTWIHAINEPRNFSNYQQQDFVEQINAYTKGKGVNVVLDMIGGDYLARNIKCMAFDARLVQIALQNGIKTDINLLPIMLKRLTITGSTLRARSVRFKAQIANQLLENVWPLLEKGHAQPVIYQSFPLSEA